MKRIGIVIGAALLGTIAFAQAAPSVPGRDPALNRAPRPAAVEALKPYEFEILPTSNACGVARKVDVRITNKKATAAEFTLTLVVGGVSNKVSATVPPEKSNVVTVAGSAQKPLDCKKALETPTVEIREGDGKGAPVLSKTVKPTELKMLASLMQPQTPPGSAAPVWLRRIEVVGACGAIPQPTATLMLTGGTAQQASVKLSFGSVSNTLSATVPPNQPTPVKLAIAGPLDCQSATGIPALEYTYSGPFPAVGKLEPQEVVFDD